MSSPFAKGGGGGSKPSPFAAPSKGGASFTGLISHLAGDVKDAVVGIPFGIEQTITHPLRTTKMFAQTTWHTWSPLFKGNFGEFAHNVYDHPLAPMLDIASVFSLGVGAAAKAGELSVGAARAAELGQGASAVTKTEKLASLRAPKSVTLKDTTGAGRHDIERNLSQRAGRRLVQETTIRLAPHLPSWFAPVSKGTAKLRYERAFLSDVAHRELAVMAQKAGALKAARSLTDPETAHIGRAEILASMHGTLVAKSPHRAPTAKDYAKVAKDYNVVFDPRYLDKTARREAAKMSRAEKRWNKIREQHAEGAHSLQSLRRQLDEAQTELRRMHREGIVQHGIMPGKPGALKKAPTAKQLMEAQAAPFKEMEANIARLEKAVEKARSSKTIHDRAISELQDAMRHRHEFENRVYGQHFKNMAASDESFRSYAENFSRHATMRGTSKTALQHIEKFGARDSEGNLILVPRHTAKAMGREASDSYHFLTKVLWTEPLKVWKTIQVGYTPRTITNNGVGNWAIYAMRSNPIGAMLGIYHGLHAVGRTRDAEEFLHGAMSVNSSWLTEFKDELGNTFKLDLKPGGLDENKLIDKLKQGPVYGAVHHISDEPVRAAALAQYMAGDAGVKAAAAALRKKGLSRQEAFNRAVRSQLVKDAKLHDRAVEYARSIAGDYTTMQGWERTLRDKVIPFYLWDRHILRTATNTLADTPGRVAVLQSISNQGIQHAEEILGPLPEFLKGAIPLSVLGLGGGSGGRTNVLSTTGLNPFATLGDLADLGQGVAVGSGLHVGTAVTGEFTPTIPSAIEWLTGKSLLTGGNIDRGGGLLQHMAKDITDSFPETKLAKAFITPDSNVTKSGNPTLYGKTTTEAVSSILGIPIKQVDLATAAGLAAKEQGKKKHRSPFAQGG